MLSLFFQLLKTVHKNSLRLVKKSVFAEIAGLAVAKKVQDSKSHGSEQMNVWCGFLLTGFNEFKFKTQRIFMWLIFTAN